MITRQGPAVVGNIPRTHHGFLSFVKKVRSQLTGSTTVTNPNPPLAVFSMDVDALDTAATKAKKGTVDDVADRNAKESKVRQHVGHIMDSVQGVADAQTTTEEAIAVILGAGFSVRKITQRQKAELAAKYNGISGQAVLVALKVKGAGAYYWEYSYDQRSWVQAPETKVSTTTIVGLTPAQMVYFRFRALTSKGKTDYSQIISFIVH